MHIFQKHRAQTLLYLLIFFLHGPGTARADRGTAEQLNQAQLSFVGIYEPSGLTYVGDGQFILIEDEAADPFHLVMLNDKGELSEAGEIAQSERPIRLNDLEGVTFDGEFVYAITSHSLTKKGKEGKDRSLLARFRYEDGMLKGAGVIKDLKPYLLTLINSHYPDRSEAKLKKQLNIEALSWSPVSRSLYVGLRAPVINGASLIIRIDQPESLFEQETASGMQAQLVRADIGGVGIRAMDWNTQSRQFDIVTGDKKKANGAFSIWSWAGSGDITSMKTLEIDKGSEGLANFAAPPLAGSVLLQDDGKRKKGKPAHYRLFSTRETFDAN